MKIIKITLFFLVALLVLASCADKMNAESSLPKKEKTVADIEAELTELSAKINALVGGAQCDVVDQCGLIELGSRPCGGPDSYKAFSSLNTDVDALLKASKAHVELSKLFNAKNNRVSICSVLEKPKVLCIKRCVVEELKIMLQ